MWFDFNGLMASEGEPVNINFSSKVCNLVAATNHMLKHLSAPSILIGHSLGGEAVLATAGQVPEAKIVATIGAPASPAHLAHNFESSRAKTEGQGEAIIQLVGRPFRFQKQFLEDI